MSDANGTVSLRDFDLRLSITFSQFLFVFLLVRK